MNIIVYSLDYIHQKLSSSLAISLVSLVAIGRVIFVKLNLNHNLANTKLTLTFKIKK